MNFNLRMKRRDDFTFVAAITKNGAPYDLTGMGSLHFSAKWRYGDPDSAAVIRLSSTGTGIHGGMSIPTPTTGIVTITIPATVTAALPNYIVNLLYDVRLWDSSGLAKTLLSGTLTIEPDITMEAAANV